METFGKKQDILTNLRILIAKTDKYKLQILH